MSSPIHASWKWTGYSVGKHRTGVRPADHDAVLICRPRDCPTASQGLVGARPVDDRPRPAVNEYQRVLRQGHFDVGAEREASWVPWKTWVT
jgi:hypothetical protein